MDITILLVIAGAGIIIGLLIGLMINALRGDSSRRSTTPSESEARAIDNILLWHDRAGGNLIVDIDGATFTGLKQMQSEQRARLETCYGQLKRFLGIQDSALPPIPIKTEQIPQIESLPSITTEVKPVEMLLPLGRGRTDQKNANPTPIKPLSIVMEIDSILQEIIAGTPLAERGLKLVETPTHTISVWIDKERYQGIDDVPDQNIQGIIRASVKQWEDKIS